MMQPLKTGSDRSSGHNILLLLPPFYTPFTPPLGISILKSFLEQKGHSVVCFDFNTIGSIWQIHHEYFRILQTHEPVHTRHDYSRLWLVLNAHLLLKLNGISNTRQASALEQIIPIYRIQFDHDVIAALVRIVDGFYEKLDEKLFELISERPYDFVGTSTFTTSLAPSLHLLRRVKEQRPKTTTLIGGGIFADDLADGSENLDTLVRNYSFIDHIVLGYGEAAFEAILNGTAAGQKVIRATNEKLKDVAMDEIPEPDFTDFELDNYYHLSIEGARSCPFECAFCSVPLLQGKFRKKTPAALVQQMSAIAGRYGENVFFMADSLMNPYINSFARSILETGADIRYDAHLRADKLCIRRDFVETWKRSGLYRARLGLESGSQHMLDLMHKHADLDTYSIAVRTLANAGIRVATYWIVGFPGETEEDFQDTLRFIREHHRYIYDIEAHPHYFFPVGQMQSEGLQPVSLYPDDITDIIKFKQYEIANATPSPEERFDRYKRLSRLAGDLGLINIYTMEGRFAAERRTLSMFPRVEAVYEGTVLRREPLPNGTVVLDSAPTTTTALVGYRIRIAEPLDTGALRAAVKAIAPYSESLRVSRNGATLSYATPDEDSLNRLVVGSEQAKTAVVEATDRIRRYGLALAFALSGNEEGSDLTVLAAPWAADVGTLARLIEDVHWAIEQQKAGIPLRLNLKSSTLLDTWSRGIPINGIPLTDDSAHRQTNVIDLEPPLARELGALTNLQALGALTAATAEACIRAARGGPPTIAVYADRRSVDAQLADVEGPLIVRWDVSAGAITDMDACFAHLTEPDRVRPEIPPEFALCLFEAASASWTGGLDWTPIGSVIEGGAIAAPAQVALHVRNLNDNLEVAVEYCANDGVASHRAEAIVRDFCRILDEKLTFSRLRERARDFVAAQRPESADVQGLEFLKSDKALPAASLECFTVAGYKAAAVPTDILLIAGFASVIGLFSDHASIGLLLEREMPDGAHVQIPVRLHTRLATVLDTAREVERLLDTSEEFQPIFRRALDDDGLRAYLGLEDIAVDAYVSLGSDTKKLLGHLCLEIVTAAAEFHVWFDSGIYDSSAVRQLVGQLELVLASPAEQPASSPPESSATSPQTETVDFAF